MNAYAEPPPPPTASPAQAAAFRPPSRIGFTNIRAVGITLSMATLSLFAIMLVFSFAPTLIIPILVAAGFASVRIYLSWTAESITASAGAALGAMTWLWLYLLWALAAGYAIFTAQGRDMIKALNPQSSQILDDPAKLVPTFIILLLIGTVSSALGGILAVRWQPRNGPSH